MQKAILAGLNSDRRSDFEKSMRETAALADAAEIEIVETITQNLPTPVTGTLIGSGKIEELKEAALAWDAELIIFDNSLTPVQQRNLSRLTEVEILDRTGLILRIFSDRARTREAILQVESAKLTYMLPRLAGMHSDLGRQAGASGAMSNKGSGEKKIELDRRHIEHRLAEYRKELASVEKERETQRKKRLNSGIPRVSLVGYTNAGKSTILNEMLAQYGKEKEKTVFEQDMLFATLDTSIREIRPGKNEKPFLLADTVGFISNLPTTLIKAFRSTLDEACYADILLLVSDVSDPDFRENLQITIDTLAEIGAGSIPRIYVFNKADKVTDFEASDISARGMTAEDAKITMSAKNPEDITRLALLIEERLNDGKVDCEMEIPYTDGGVLNALKKGSDLEILEYTEKGTRIHVVCSKEDAARYARFIVK